MTDASFEIVDPNRGQNLVQGFVPNCGYVRGVLSTFLVLPVNVHGQ